MESVNPQPDPPERPHAISSAIEHILGGAVIILEVLAAFLGHWEGLLFAMGSLSVHGGILVTNHRVTLSLICRAPILIGEFLLAVHFGIVVVAKLLHLTIG